MVAGEPVAGKSGTAGSDRGPLEKDLITGTSPAAYRCRTPCGQVRSLEAAVGLDNGRMGEDPEDVEPPVVTVWIFHGEGSRFASGVFADRSSALDWVARHRLTGIVSEYQVGDGCYDFALRRGRFRDTKPHHGLPQHVAGFSPGLDHVHVQDGQPET